MGRTVTGWLAQQDQCHRNRCDTISAVEGTGHESDSEWYELENPVTARDHIIAGAAKML